MIHHGYLCLHSVSCAPYRSAHGDGLDLMACSDQRCDRCTLQMCLRTGILCNSGGEHLLADRCNGAHLGVVAACGVFDYVTGSHSLIRCPGSQTESDWILGRYQNTYGWLRADQVTDSTLVWNLGHPRS